MGDDPGGSRYAGLIGGRSCVLRQLHETVRVFYRIVEFAGIKASAIGVITPKNTITGMVEKLLACVGRD